MKTHQNDQIDVPSFDKHNYAVAKQHAIRRIKNSHDWERSEGFIADGVICPDQYEKEPIRILCVLAESYGYAEEGMEDIENQPTHDIMGLANPTVQAPRKLATMLWLLLESFERKQIVTWDEFPDDLFQVNPVNTGILQATLAKVAWINLKKASRLEGTVLNTEELYSHAQRNSELLDEQIKSVAPHLILVCGESVFRASVGLNLFGQEVVLARKWYVQQGRNGSKVVEVTHPSTWRGYEKLYERFLIIYNQVAV